ELLRTTVSWYERRLAELGVEVRLGVLATPASVLAEDPEAVIIAAGSRYRRDGDSAFRHGAIAGADRMNVFRPEQILEEGAHPRGGRGRAADHAGLRGARPRARTRGKDRAGLRGGRRRGAALLHGRHLRRPAVRAAHRREGRPPHHGRGDLQRGPRRRDAAIV